MKYTTLLFDADDTLLDFKECERTALKKVFEKYKLPYNEEIRRRYLEINHGLWSAFERGEVTKEEILGTRFRKLFSELSIEGVRDTFEADYQNFLGENGCLIPGALELCQELSGRFAIYIVTNGVSATQYGRFRDSGLLPYIRKIFVSEEIGFQKPAVEYFNIVLERIEETDKSRILMIGDSLNSDILGGNRAGLPTCWYNPEHKENNSEAVPDYIVSDYEKLQEIINQ